MLTLLTADTTVCVNTQVALSGLLRIANWGSYELLGNEPIGGRQVVIKRNGTPISTVTTNATNGTYSANVLSVGAATFSFTADFSQVGNGDISPDVSPPVSITWSSAYC